MNSLKMVASGNTQMVMTPVIIQTYSQRTRQNGQIQIWMAMVTIQMPSLKMFQSGKILIMMV